MEHSGRTAARRVRYDFPGSIVVGIFLIVCIKHGSVDLAGETRQGQTVVVQDEHVTDI
jgi:hypothetical protein